MRREERDRKNVLCKYFARGECKFGPKCRFSHEIVEVFIMRHAQSVYNELVENEEMDSFSQEAKEKFQMSEHLIDCGVTKQGLEQIRKMKFPLEIVKESMYFDLIFVSPLERTLQTLTEVMAHHKVKTKQVIVMPFLTEVLSKICDFSGEVASKKINYPHFDFSRLDRMNRNSFWQDSLVDEVYQEQILSEKQDGKRFMRILDSIFPTPLEDRGRCFDRTMKVIGEIKSISQKEKASRILVVSHNRVLKYMMGRDSRGRADSFENCEIKPTIF